MLRLFNVRGGGANMDTYSNTHTRVDVALCPYHKPTHRAPRRLTADLLPSMSAPALSHLPLLNGLCTALCTHPKSQNFQSLIVLKISWSCTADTPNSPFRARGGARHQQPLPHLGCRRRRRGRGGRGLFGERPLGRFRRASPTPRAGGRRLNREGEGGSQ